MPGISKNRNKHTTLINLNHNIATRISLSEKF